MIFGLGPCRMVGRYFECGFVIYLLNWWFAFIDQQSYM